MHRFYMTAETRQAVIAESNRLIASRTAMGASRQALAAESPAEPPESEWPASQGDPETAGSSVESAFARLVSDLQATTSGSRPS